jgi:hypothetical protein
MSSVPAIVMQDQSEAAHFLSLLDESAETFCFRVFDDNESRKDPRLAAKYEGGLADVWPALLSAQQKGCGVYVVANAGEQTNDTIYKVRAVFADTDGAPLDPILSCGLEPHIIVESSPGKWHAYWLVDGLPLSAFRDVQRSIAARFGTDKSVNDLARVMRLPGLLHQKGLPFRTRIIHESGALPYDADTILANFPPAPLATAPAPTAAHGLAPGTVIDTNRHADVLKCTLLLAQAVHSGAMTRLEAFNTMRARRDAGRYSRHVPDEEIARALDGALAKRELAPAEPEAPAPLLTLAPLSLEELEEAKKPQANAFMGGWKGQVGMFPVGEVTVIGAPGREGKTSVMMAIAQQYALGQPVAGLNPEEIRSVLIYSAEDDRQQYARKVGAHLTRLGAEEGDLFRRNLLIPDLHSEEIASWREIVTLRDREPVRGKSVQALIEAIRPRMAEAMPPGLLIFETASTLSDAEENNQGHKVMVAALKHIAKTLNLAVVLMHHTSQQAASNLPDLNISESDIRGGTTLVNNARQCFLLVNLGSDKDPFADGDARTLLRKLAAAQYDERITALICLNSSKGMDPPPVFFRWDITEDYGPRLVEVKPPERVAGKSWKAVKAMLAGVRAEAKADKKAEQGQANVRLCVRLVHELAEKGEQPTVKRVSTAAGRNPGWAKPYLEAAAEDGSIVRVVEEVPRNGLRDVFRPVPGSLPWQKEG